MTDEEFAAVLGLDHAGGADPGIVASLRAHVVADEPPGHVALDGVRGQEIVLALAEIVPDALARHRREGIPEPISLATLRDVGRKHRLYGAETVVPWLIGVLRGDVVEVGRLQVERRPGPHGHALHVPETGPLLPSLVDESLGRAVDITGSRTFSCTSWLLSPRTATALPGSNIARFSARFRIVEAGQPSSEANAAVAKFVFRRPVADILDPALIPQSRLERLVAETLRAGEEWTEPVGVTAVEGSVL